MEHLAKLVLVWLLLTLLSERGFAEGFQRFDDPMSQSLAEKGQKQLSELEQKAHLPRYGECWLQALGHLRDGCRMLTDTIQVDLALHLTNCFMDMSGQERLDCLSERTEGLKRLCMSEMSDRAFAVYTEFFTQTQNMCYFLESQRWQQEVDRTIDRLSVRSREVSEQLEEAGEVQRVVLEHQKQGLKLQSDMLQLGGSLARSLNGSQVMLDKLTVDLRNSTKEHQAVLKDLFREFYILHSWIVGRYAFVDRVIFYLCFLLVLMVATSTSRTSNARSYLILNLISSLVLEVTTSNLLPLLDEIQKDQLYWTIRKLFTLSALAIFFYFSYRYQDQNAKLLSEIQQQNREIMESILRMKLEEASVPPKSHPTDDKETQSIFGSAASSIGTATTMAQPHSAILRESRRRLLILPPLMEPDTTDYERENSSNERRSTSRPRSRQRTPLEKEARALQSPSYSSRASEVSTDSRASGGYNLRGRRTISHTT